MREQKAFLWLSGILLTLFTWGTIERNQIWRSELSLWSDAVIKSPQKSRPRLALAQTYKHESFKLKLVGRVQESREFLILALRHLNAVPTNPDADDKLPGLCVTTNRNVAALSASNFLYELGDYAQAQKILREILRDEPKNLTALLNLSSIYRVNGQFEIARSMIDEADGLYPDNPAVLHVRAEFLMVGGRCDLAIKDYERAHQLDPDTPDIHAAIRDYDEARKLDPKMPQNPCRSL